MKLLNFFILFSIRLNILALMLITSTSGGVGARWFAVFRSFCVAWMLQKAHHYQPVRRRTCCHWLLEAIVLLWIILPKAITAAVIVLVVNLLSAKWSYLLYIHHICWNVPVEVVQTSLCQFVSWNVICISAVVLRLQCVTLTQLILPHKNKNMAMTKMVHSSSTSTSCSQVFDPMILTSLGGTVLIMQLPL